jgi:hypothetical protein
MKDSAGPAQQLGFGLEHEEKRTSGGNDAERLVSGVEDERSRHALDYLCMRCLRGIRKGLLPIVTISGATPRT